MPIVFFLNVYAFLIGSVFVVAIEFHYLKKLMEGVDRKSLFWLVLKFNLFSTLFGVIVLPLFIAIIGLEPLSYMVKSNASQDSMTHVWWLSLSLDLLLAYIGTVIIEYLTLKKIICFNNKFTEKALKSHVLTFNAYSYLVLIVLILLTYGCFRYLID